MKKRLVIGLSLLILLSSIKPEKLTLKIKFNIEKILIENNTIIEEQTIKKDLISLYKTNLFFLNTKNIEEILKKNNFIESFEIKKIYPNKIKIKIFEKKPIAILHFKNKKFYISEKLDYIDYLDLEDYKNLPNVFGGKENFKKFYNDLKEINFPLNTIKNFYFYETKRWDLEIFENKIIKLPAENYIKSIKSFMNFKKENNFDKYKVLDYRINGQLILK